MGNPVSPGVKSTGKVTTGAMTNLEADPNASNAPYNPYTNAPQAYSTGGGLGPGQSFDEQQAAANQAAQAQKARANAAAHPGAFSANFGANIAPNVKATAVDNSKIIGGYQGTSAPDPNANMGLDFSRQGASEAFFDKNQSQFTQPSQSGAVSNMASAQLGGPSMSEGFSKQVAERYPNGMPALDADMSKYYENAKRRAAEGIDQQMAARGLYASSAATDRIGEAFTDLEAQRAKDEASYGLQRNQAELGWQTGLSSIMGNADQAKNSRLGTMGGLASAADSARLGGLSAGMDAAHTAQGDQRQRGEDAFSRQYLLDSTMSGMAGGAYDSMIANDQNLLDQIAALLGGNAANEATAVANKGASKSAGADSIGNAGVDGVKAVYTYGASEAAKDDEKK